MPIAVPLRARDPADREVPLLLEVHRKQWHALHTPSTEVLYGGAAGGGKSHLLRVAATLWAHNVPGLQIYLFRRQMPDLFKNHVEGPHGFRSLLAPWFARGCVSLVGSELRFRNGSKVYLCHCHEEADRFNYQGTEMHVLLVDELTHFTERMYRFLRSRVRAVGIPGVRRADLLAQMPRILCASNPGNLGHHWVKAAFLDGAVPERPREMGDAEGGMVREYVPARLDDNPYLLDDDPTYRGRLRGLGSSALVRAMEEGDWSVVEGAFFECWSSARHVIKPFPIPKWWMRFRSFDWGSASPFSVGWWAVAGETITTPSGTVIPRHAMVRYREWYGASAPGAGLKLPNDRIANGIRMREQGEAISFGVADPSIFRADGGPSIAEQMGRRGVMFRKADNRRVGGRGPVSGWDQLRRRLLGEDGRPMIFCFETCVDSIRTIPALLHDSDNPEDVDTNGEDHAADEWRYACMSRAWTRSKPVEAPQPPPMPTIGELLAAHKRKREED